MQVSYAWSNKKSRFLTSISLYVENHAR